jgi:hypothetical protein
MWIRASLKRALCVLFPLASELVACEPLVLDLGSTGAGGVAPTESVPDSCPRDVMAGLDCSDYADDATCKLGQTWFRCEEGLWQLAGTAEPGEEYPLPVEDLVCPLELEPGLSCERYAELSRCRSGEGEWFECARGIWTEVEP